MKNKTAADFLIESAEIYKERSKAYGDGYKTFGALVLALFPGGVALKTEEDMNRYGVLSMMMSKLHRYANNFSTGGHHDSLVDLSTYSAMLNELDASIARPKNSKGSLCEERGCLKKFSMESPECKTCMKEAREG